MRKIRNLKYPNVQIISKLLAEKFQPKAHKPSTDCCSICDKLSMLGNTFDIEKYHKEARRARSILKEDSQMPHTITFDMHKTLPLPHLHANRVIYLIIDV